MKDAVYQVSTNMSETAISVSDGTITAERSSDNLEKSRTRFTRFQKIEQIQRVINSKTTMANCRRRANSCK